MSDPRPDQSVDLRDFTQEVSSATGAKQSDLTRREPACDETQQSPHKKTKKDSRDFEGISRDSRSEAGFDSEYEIARKSLIESYELQEAELLDYGLLNTEQGKTGYYAPTLVSPDGHLFRSRFCELPSTAEVLDVIDSESDIVAEKFAVGFDTLLAVPNAIPSGEIGELYVGALSREIGYRRIRNSQGLDFTDIRFAGFSDLKDHTERGLYLPHSLKKKAGMSFYDVREKSEASGNAGWDIVMFRSSDDARIRELIAEGVIPARISAREYLELLESVAEFRYESGHSLESYVVFTLHLMKTRRAIPNIGPGIVLFGTALVDADDKLELTQIDIDEVNGENPVLAISTDWERPYLGVDTRSLGTCVRLT